MLAPAEFDVDAIEGIAGKAMDVALKRLGIRLDKRRSEDLHEYLVDLGFRMAMTYDPTVGQAFSTWFYRRARLRVIDWLRITHGDKRKKTGILAKLEFSYPSVSLEAISDNGHERTHHRALAIEDPERDPLSDAIVALGQDLSPGAQWTLTAIAGRMAEGATITQAALEAGLHTRRARRQLEELGEELAESPLRAQTSRNDSAQASGAMPGNDAAKPLPATSGHRSPEP